MDPVRRLSDPGLRNPVALVAFEGWNDASDAASGTVSYLIGQHDAEPFLIIDPEEFIDFHETRPIVSVADGVTERLAWPATRMYGVQQEGAQDLLLVLGDEPQLRWQTFGAILVDELRRIGVDQVVMLGAFLGQVPHTAPVPIFGTAGSTDELIRLGLSGANYEGPTGIVGVLAHLFREEGIPALSLWAATSHYLGTNPNPKAMLALLERAAAILGISIDATELAEIAGEFEVRVDAAMSASEEFSTYVTRLETLAEGADLEDSAAADLISEVEDFLKDN
ncbi:MAG: PAC2 family protein [Acidimicrobiia bacterium]|nr:PAC2 family protein [Acidimicrobiia bacterium]NNF89465.1 PAC2 family protein [Acidimicrobiia bacterium]NNJ47262.1 PAC2 family protein [Acidimicrobiia bacterium]NNL98377.1 PAC2 family protein [Acidimicrobiia bacterium]